MRIRTPCGTRFSKKIKFKKIIDTLFTSINNLPPPHKIYKLRLWNQHPGLCLSIALSYIGYPTTKIRLNWTKYLVTWIFLKKELRFSKLIISAYLSKSMFIISNISTVIIRKLWNDWRLRRLHFWFWKYL